MRRRSVQAAFWTAVTLGLLALMSVPSAPVLGIAEATLFFVAAWSIWRGCGWAALAAAVLMTVPALSAASTMKMPLVAAALAGLFDAGLVWGGVTLLRTRRTGGGRESAAWIAAAVFVFGASATQRPMMLPSSSMEPTIAKGEQVLLETVSQRSGRRPARDELVAFHAPFDARQIFVKRVAGVAGDRIQLVNKRLYRNGAAVDEPYATHTAPSVDAYRDNFPSVPPQPLYATGQAMLLASVRDGAVIVPPGMLFVLGDNRDSSLDSRYWGFVDERAVIGRPWLVYGTPDAPVHFRLLAPARTR
jgi:signal peptidase I